MWDSLPTDAFLFVLLGSNYLLKDIIKLSLVKLGVLSFQFGFLCRAQFHQLSELIIIQFSGKAAAHFGAGVAWRAFRWHRVLSLG